MAHDTSSAYRLQGRCVCALLLTFSVLSLTNTCFSLQDGGHDSDTSGRTLSPGSQSQSRGRKPKEEEPERGILDNVKERLKPVLLPETNSEEYFHRSVN